ncbi:MAG: acyl-CoA dehydrogenase family protein, partial [Alphaproteobacteria bacterium]|nr:acyl-CoA dehydrogenase family protein [Alphaproteobacteria bacterium]
MPSYTAPLKDYQFVLHDLLKVSEQDVPGYADLDRDFTGAVLEEAGKISSDVLSPLNVVGDTMGCVLENGVVRTPTGFKAAFDQVREGGWTGMDVPEQYGGQGLPYIMHTAAQEPMVSANMAFNMYQGLTHGAYSAIHVHGTDAQKQMFLPKMVSCEWTGTMNLTEPQCG